MGTPQKTLTVFFNAGGKGAEANHIRYEGVLQLSYRREAETPLQLIIDSELLRRKTPEEIKKMEQPGVEIISSEEAFIRTFDMHANFLTVLPSLSEDLEVHVGGIKLEKAPIAVSFAKEKKSQDKDTMSMCVIEFDTGTVIDRNFGGEAFCERFGVFSDFKKKRKIRTDKATRDDPVGMWRVLMMNEEANLGELRHEGPEIDQLFVVGVRNKAERCINALTGKKPPA